MEESIFTFFGGAGGRFSVIQVKIKSTGLSYVDRENRRVKRGEKEARSDSYSNRMIELFFRTCSTEVSGPGEVKDLGLATSLQTLQTQTVRTSVRVRVDRAAVR